jgi:hypothetical protein
MEFDTGKEGEGEIMREGEGEIMREGEGDGMSARNI